MAGVKERSLTCLNGVFKLLIKFKVTFGCESFFVRNPRFTDLKNCLLAI